MTSQRLVEDYARWLWVRDTHWDFKEGARTPDSYMNEAAVFLAGELGQRLQHARQIEAVRELHQEETEGPWSSGYCRDCEQSYPCNTAGVVFGGAS